MNNKFWREIFDQITSLVMVFRIEGSTVELMFVNKAVHTHLGYTPEAFVMESEQDGDLRNSLSLLVAAVAEGARDVVLDDLTGRDTMFNIAYRTFFSDAIKEELAILTLHPATSGQQPGSADQSVVAESMVMKSVIERIRQLEEVGASIAYIGGAGTGKRFFMDRTQRVAVDNGVSIWKLDYSSTGKSIYSMEGVQVDFDTMISMRLRKDTMILIYGIEDMPIDEQLRLNQFVDGQETRLRYICGSTESPDALVSSCKLMPELYYKLNVISVVLPSLDMRRADIRPYADRWLRRVCEIVGTDIPVVSDLEWTRLFHHAYSGGYDDLNAILLRSLAYRSKGVFQFDLLADDTATKKGYDTSASVADTIILRFDASHDDHMRAYLEQVMVRHGWKLYGRDGAASHLGMKPTTLQSKLEKYGVRKN